ncbi:MULTISPECIES: MmcQ/YjbR family DNA-binding protein [Vibrio]|uniref:MmcQ/YjbR family DNA-binding protein n=1 Tax=Vibrio ostreae TaxID=2841925 RepID=A0A975U7Z1_9VIBR|nr:MULTISPECIES: MmcQ/YjbR family DNA-binding protein [Vibrio]QXO15539.1 MmcQ/YjbR family DNA-binding protein [Vibrio ostreae]WGY45487.1 MmcQ/YjbR family DNA-binding protein [Vibrio sp. ABG19]
MALTNTPRQTLIEFIESLPQVQADYPFGPEPLVYKIRGKMFVLFFESASEWFVNLKCTPQDGEILTSQFNAIRPGYHMNKRHWISVALQGDVEPGMIEDLCLRSYQLVVNKLRKGEREALQRLWPQGKA